MTERSLRKDNQCERLQERQRGSALIVSLVMLLLITLIAVAGMQTTIMQERMSANLRDRDLAFQAAETALRAGENYLFSTATSSLTFDNTGGLYQMNAPARPAWAGGSGSSTITYSGSLKDVSKQPEYFIEKIDTLVPAGTSTETGAPMLPLPYFRVTARGFGGSPDTFVVVSSVYRNQ